MVSMGRRLPAPSSAAPLGQVCEDLRGTSLERREVAEHYRVDVELGESFHAPFRHGLVVAVQAARERNPPEPPLERVTHEQHAVARAIEAHAAWRMAWRVYHAEPAEQRQ